MNKITVENNWEFQEVIDGGKVDSYDFEFVEESPWVAEHKYETREVIIRRVSDNTFWKYVDARSGSYFTEYHYESSGVRELEIYQVEAVEVTTKKWEYV